MPEAGLHLLEAVVAADVAEVQLSDVSWTLITEGQAFFSSQSGCDSVSCTAVTVISSLSSTILDFCCSLDRAGICSEVHGHERFFGVGVEVAFS